MGKLRDRTIANELISILTDSGELTESLSGIESFLEKPYWASTGFSYIYFQLSTHSIRALIRIGEEFTEIRAEILKTFDYFYENYLNKIKVDKSLGYISYLLHDAIPNVIKITRERWRK